MGRDVDVALENNHRSGAFTSLARLMDMA